MPPCWIKNLPVPIPVMGHDQIRDKGIENEATSPTQMAGGHVEVLDGSQPGFLASFSRVGKYLGDQNVEQVQSVI